MTARPPITDAVVAAAASALGMPTVPLDANFFELGGDSLAALEVTSLLQERLGCDLDVELLYESDDLAAYAARVAALTGA